MKTRNWLAPARKSSYSTAANNCVEFQPHTEGVVIRDTKDRRPEHILDFTPEAWQSFLAELPQLTS